VKLRIDVVLGVAALAAGVALAAAPTFAAGPARTDKAGPAAANAAVAKTLTRLRADRDMRELLLAQAAMKPKPIEKTDVANARRNPTIAAATAALLRQQGRSSRPDHLVPGVKALDTTVQGAVGSLPARVYTPAGDGPFPVVVYYHGGGWVLADRIVYDASARGLAKAAGAVVVSVDYRQAPENKFPAAWDDAAAAYKWTVENAATLNGDPTRVALAGEGAGGTLALATAIAARERSLQKPAHVLAIYPVTQTRLSTESYREYATAPPLSRLAMRWFFDKAIVTRDDLKDPRMDLVAADLSGLPQVTLINARIDPLRSDGVLMEAALRKAGVAVERREYDGVTHEFFGAAAVVQKARDAQQYAGERLKQAFGS
jgi:acetyl esterase/lipase